MIVPGSGRRGLVRVTPKVQYSVPLASSDTTDIVLAKYIDTTLWVSGQLIVRVHAVSFTGAPTAAVIVQNTSFAEEDPATDFVNTTAVATATITTTFPDLLVTTFSAALASQLRVILRLTQAGGSSADIDVTIGVDLVGRPA